MKFYEIFNFLGRAIKVCEKEGDISHQFLVDFCTAILIDDDYAKKAAGDRPDMLPELKALSAIIKLLSVLVDRSELDSSVYPAEEKVKEPAGAKGGK